MPVLSTPNENSTIAMKPKLLIADDHRMVADAICAFLMDRYDVVDVVSDGIRLTDCIRLYAPHIVLADINMPHLNGIEVLRQMQFEPERPAFVFISVHAEPALVKEAMSRGASGYVLKGEPGEILVQALDEALEGRTWISESLRLPPAAIPNTPRLTVKQSHILALIAEGMKSREIAAMLGISIRTVETHRHAIMRTLGANTSISLINKAVSLGLLATPIKRASA